MHIKIKAMKLFNLPLICLIILPSLFAFQQHDQNLGYTHPAIVVKDGVSYISVQTVPSGTPITSTSYWTPLLNTAPTNDPGAPPTTEPDTSDSDLGNLTPPEDNSTSENTFTPGYRRDGTPMDPSIPTHFDVDGYYDRNWDVRDDLQDESNDGVLAYEHYLKFGISEDRMFDNDFVPLEYVEINTDLRVAFTDENGSVDLIKAVNHWFNFGMGEGRLGRFAKPDWFDAQQYMDNHWDVRDAIDDDSPFGKETEAWWHFYRIGAPREDRSWNDEEFNLDAYISLNQDVYVSFQKADGTVDKKRAMYHYIYAGNSEGRVDKFSVPAWFDSSEYLNNNSDVASGSWGTSEFRAFNHFFRFGALEGRTTSTFDLDIYINSNQDVWIDRQEDKYQTVLHYIAYGYSEGRKAF